MRFPRKFTLTIEILLPCKNNNGSLPNLYDVVSTIAVYISVVTLVYI